MTLPLKVYIKKKKNVACSDYHHMLTEILEQIFFECRRYRVCNYPNPQTIRGKNPRSKLKSKYLHYIVKDRAIHYLQNTRVGRQESPTHLWPLNSAQKRFFR
jgi:hypothetical protein